MKTSASPRATEPYFACIQRNREEIINPIITAGSARLTNLFNPPVRKHGEAYCESPLRWPPMLRNPARATTSKGHVISEIVFARRGPDGFKKARKLT